MIGALALSGCTTQEPDAIVSESPTSEVTTAPSETAAPSAPALVPDGTAQDNLPYFTSVVESVWATPENAQGRAYIDALVAAGFDKTAMQVTNDQSTVGNAAESIQFSVRWGEECLIGQVGPSTGQPVTATAQALQGGFCLIGQTRPIDW